MVAMSTTDGSATAALASELERALRPLTDALADPGTFALFVQGHGWTGGDGTKIEDVRVAFALGPDLQAIADDVAQLDAATGDARTALYADILRHVGNVLQKVQQLSAVSPKPGLSAPLNNPAFWAQIGTELFDEILWDWLQSYHPPVFAVLLGLGVLEEAPQPSPAEPGRVAYTRRSVEWDRLPDVVQPPKLMGSTYGWGTPTLDWTKLLSRIARLLQAIGVPTFVRVPSTVALDEYYAPANAVRNQLKEIAVPVVGGVTNAGAWAAGVTVLPIPPGPGDVPVGVRVSPFVQGTIGALETGPVAVSLRGRFSVDGGIHLEIRPSGIRVTVAGTPPLELDDELAITWRDIAPIVVVGPHDGAHLQADSVRLALSLEGRPADVDATLRFAVEAGKLVIPAGDGDSFLAKVLGPDEKTVEFDVAVTWSSKRGFGLNGTAGLRLRLPVNKTLLAAHVSGIAIGVEPVAGGVSLTAGADADAKIGPVAAAIAAVGVRLDVGRPVSGAEPGALGGRDVSFRFKPPTGVGLSIDSAVVKGGGFLSFDEAQAQYAGALHLDIEGVSLNAIGILTTRLPGGQPGFSLLIIISAAGFTPFPIGFGFSLTGVGGLLGINRDVSTPALQAGLKTHALDSVLLSKDDPVPRAAQLIQQLQTIFPPAPDSYVFGPTAQISWGTPTVLTIDVALLIRLPAPVRLYVLGRLRAFLPTDDAALVRLNMDVLGVVDFGKGTVAIDAILYDSKILAFALTGGMALRASWRDDPSFALAVGGFNRRFVPPPGFPHVDRLALTLSSGDNPKLRVEAYLALTSNTVQFGADADFRIALGDVALAGGFGFDALIQLSPFEFVVDVSASLVLTYKGASLLAVAVQLTLTGPAPLRARGTASFSILFFSISVSFDVTLVEGQKPGQPGPIDVWTEHLKLELQDSRNWTAQLPAEGGRIVTLAVAAPPGPDDVVCHPLGTLSVHQRVVPFDRDLDRFGSRGIIGGRRFTVRDLALGGVSQGPSLAKVVDEFAPAQFRELSDDEKLRAPSFEPMTAGASVGGGTVAGAPVKKTLGFATIVVRNGSAAAGKRFTPSADTIRQLAQAGAAAGAGTRTTGRAKYHNRLLGIGVGAPAYVVATKTGLRQAAAGDGTYTGAAEALRAYVAANPDEAGDVQIVRASELV